MHLIEASGVVRQVAGMESSRTGRAGRTRAGETSGRRHFVEWVGTVRGERDVHCLSDYIYVYTARYQNNR